MQGIGLGGTLGDIDPLSKVPGGESQKRVQKCSLLRVPLILPRKYDPLEPKKGTCKMYLVRELRA